MNRDILEELKSHLSELSQNEIAQQCFDKIAKCCFLNLIEDQNNTKLLDSILSKLEENDKKIIYELFNTLMLFCVQCIQKNFTDSEVMAILIDIGWTQQIVEGYLQKLNQFKSFINDPENALVFGRFESKIPMQQLIDMDWQQEIIISSKYANKIYQEIYKLDLTLLDEKTKKSSIVFKCTLPQLIEINNQLGVIVKNIEKNSDLSHLKKN